MYIKIHFIIHQQLLTVHRRTQASSRKKGCNLQYHADQTGLFQIFLLFAYIVCFLGRLLRNRCIFRKTEDAPSYSQCLLVLSLILQTLCCSMSAMTVSRSPCTGESADSSFCCFLSHSSSADIASLNCPEYSRASSNLRCLLNKQFYIDICLKI